MPTHDYIIDNSTGQNVRQDINNALAAIVSNNSGSSEPTTKYAYQWWADTSAGVLKIRNSANNAWVELLQLDGTITLEDGSASSPALSFRDDLNTGVFSSAADTFNVATGGVERMELGTTTIFNEDGADVDFRIEGDTEANLFYVDAGNNRIGIGTSIPEDLLHLKSGKIRIENAIVSNNDSTISYDNQEFIIDVDPNNVRGPSKFQIKIDAGTALIIDDNRNVGIGTTNPAVKFVVSNAGAEGLEIGHSSGTVDINAYNRSTSARAPVGIVGQTFTVATGNPTLNTGLFQDSSGNVCIGTTTARSGTNALTFEASNSFIQMRASGTGSLSQISFMRNTASSAVQVGDISTTGSATTYATSSDYRLKENLENITDGITRIKQLAPKRFNFIVDADTKVDGFLAHEAQTVVPEAVTGIKDEVDSDNNPVYQGIDQSKLVPLLVAAVKELIGKVEALEAA